jgi:2-amino-4-hydroxy-6-hydroxymethyldihydropteridine diphosphokinase
MPLTRGYIALGTNIGDRLKYLKQAIALLECKNVLIVTASSRIYENRAIGIKKGNDFYNAVIEIYTGLSPQALLSACQQIESEMGRERSNVWINRIIDIDLLYLEGVCVDSEHLKIPHPEISSRDFVLKPLSELNPLIEIEGRGVLEYLSEIEPHSMTVVESILYPDTQINQIVAVDQNNVIGLNGKLPWSIDEDWAIFLGKTKKGLLIMGRTSFLEMIKEPNWDKDREYIVVTSHEDLVQNKCVQFVDSVERAIELAKSSGKTVWICGGASLYQSTFKDTDALFLTRIDRSFKGDTYFSDFKQFLPNLASQIKSSNDAFSYSFQIWKQ